MVYDARAFALLRNRAFCVGGLAWALLLLEPGAASYCSVPGSSISWRLVFAVNPPADLARGWALMLAAMMSPVLAPAIHHICLGCFARRRARSISCFVAGYGAVWMAAGAVLLLLKLVAGELAPGSLLPAFVVGALALIWQASPLKQSCLNRCHRHRPFAAFGFASDRDLLCFGLEHGVWCAGSCSLLMLFPMLLPEGHVIAMAAVGVLIYCERLDPPAAPAWRWRGFGAAFRAVEKSLRGPRGAAAPSALGSPN